jgi:hypothetical protein
LALPTEIVIILLGWRCGFIRPWGRGKFEDKRIEVRLGYYIIGKKPKLRGRWGLGQFAALLPLRDFRALIRAAEKKRWI